MSDFGARDRRRRWQDYSQEEFDAALAAGSGTKCSQCPHTKGEHHPAGPICFRCDCPGFVVKIRDEVELVSGLDAVNPEVDGEELVPTLGEIAALLEPLLKVGVTRGAMLYVVDRVWWEDVARESREAATVRGWSAESFTPPVFNPGMLGGQADG